MALKNTSPQERKEILVLLQDFRDLQEERTRQYHCLNNSHKVYLETGQQTGGQVYDLDTYKVCVKESTDKFKSISSKILDIARKLEELSKREEKENQPPISLMKQIQVGQPLCRDVL